MIMMMMMMLMVVVGCSCQVESAVQLLRGRIYEAMDNRSQAVDCYRTALLLDVRCYEAFDCLVQHHMMSAAEGLLHHLLDKLKFAIRHERL